MTAYRPSAPLCAMLGAVVALLALALAIVVLAGHAAAQTEPPSLGLGDWSIADSTVLQDRFVLLNGSLIIGPGGDLEMRNSTIIFVLNSRGEHGILVRPGGTLRVLEGSRIAGSRLGMGWTFMAQAGSRLRVLGSSIQDCGNFGYGYSANWQVISFYIGTEDAVLEGSSFSGGFVGPCYPDGVIAPPPRNSTETSPQALQLVMSPIFSGLPKIGARWISRRSSGWPATSLAWEPISSSCPARGIRSPTPS